jgi:hypothetical protein
VTVPTRAATPSVQELTHEPPERPEEALSFRPGLKPHQDCSALGTGSGVRERANTSRTFDGTYDRLQVDGLDEVPVEPRIL